MRFDLVDAVVDLGAERIVTLKHVTAGEEYLRDHFEGFPVLPGVLMLEAMVQAARRLAVRDRPGIRWVLGEVRALKYGHLVRPGDTLRVTVTLSGQDDQGLSFRGEGHVCGAGRPEPGVVAASGRFGLRPLRGGLA
ncbi:MAG: polyketide synthase dehydratase domain-containing protein [Phycisphaeraceae bacterium]|nr:polyketide synthase dehydratase domain-containing protein [Phycisphaeraceae bacterium]MCW5755323.1 polyketide synthase dehydratase domain-containing protein [Phycisphaeraceae bacterium]